MVYDKREFFLILPLEGCAFQKGEGDEDSWLGVGVYEKKSVGAKTHSLQPIA